MTLGRWVALLFLAVSIGYGALAWRLEDDFPGVGAEFTPRTYPLVLAAIGALLALLLLRSEARPEARQPREQLAWARLGWLAALMVLYTLGIQGLGLWLSTVLFLIAGFLLLGERRLRWLLPVATGVAAAFHLLATRLLGIYIDDPFLSLLGLS